MRATDQARERACGARSAEGEGAWGCRAPHGREAGLCYGEAFGWLRRALAARGVQGLAKGPAAQLPAAKHVFTHLEWHMTGWHFCCGPDAPVPDGCAFAAPEQLQAQYSVPGAFHAYRQYAEKILFASCKTEKNGL